MHGQGRCPGQYDASDNAAAKHFHRLKELIQTIQECHHQPGDGLIDIPVQTSFVPQPPSEKKVKKDRVRLE